MIPLNAEQAAEMVADLAAERILELEREVVALRGHLRRLIEACTESNAGTVWRARMLEEARAALKAGGK